MPTNGQTPDTIVLIHGLWMTPRSWEEWIAYYEEQGYNVVAPGYPGFEIEVEALREDPSVISSLTVPQVVAHLASVITELDRPPIIMADEPTGALDSKTGHMVINMLRRLCDQQGKTVIVVTHDQKVASFADRVITLQDGGIVEDRMTSPEERENAI